MILDACLPCSGGIYNTHTECNITAKWCRQIQVFPDIADVFLVAIRFTTLPVSTQTMWTIRGPVTSFIDMTVTRFSTKNETCSEGQLAVLDNVLDTPRVR